MSDVRGMAAGHNPLMRAIRINAHGPARNQTHTAKDSLPGKEPSAKSSKGADQTAATMRTVDATARVMTRNWRVRPMPELYSLCQRTMASPR